MHHTIRHTYTPFPYNFLRYDFETIYPKYQFACAFYSPYGLHCSEYLLVFTKCTFSGDQYHGRLGKLGTTLVASWNIEMSALFQPLLIRSASTIFEILGFDGMC